MITSYWVKYRQPGQWFWRIIKGITGDGIEGMFRYFLTQDDQYICISIQAEVRFPPERNMIIVQKLSKEAGINIPRG